VLEEKGGLQVRKRGPPNHLRCEIDQPKGIEISSSGEKLVFPQGKGSCRNKKLTHKSRKSFAERLRKIVFGWWKRHSREGEGFAGGGFRKLTVQGPLQSKFLTSKGERKERNGLEIEGTCT